MIGYGQSYDTIATIHYNLYASKNNGILNYTDAKGLKQGLWIKYNMTLCSHYVDLVPVKHDTCFTLLSIGKYNDNKKNGKWKYFDEHSYYRGYYYPSEIEDFKNDGSIEKTSENYSIITNFSSDSLKVTSIVKGHNNDEFYEILIDCNNTKECIATFLGKELVRFDYNDLDLEKFKIINGLYDRQIRLLKQESNEGDTDGK